MIIFIGITLNNPLIKYGKAIIHSSFHKSEHQDYVSFHEYKHQDFVNLDEAILCKLKRIVSHEGLYIVYQPNKKGYWYNVIV